MLPIKSFKELLKIGKREGAEEVIFKMNGEYCVPTIGSIGDSPTGKRTLILELSSANNLNDVRTTILENLLNTMPPDLKKKVEMIFEQLDDEETQQILKGSPAIKETVGDILNKLSKEN